MLPKVLIGPVLRGDADDRTVQQAAALELIERHKGHLARQIPADTERDKGIGHLRALVVLRHWHSWHPVSGFSRSSLGLCRSPIEALWRCWGCRTCTSCDEFSGGTEQLSRCSLSSGHCWRDREGLSHGHWDDRHCSR